MKAQTGRLVLCLILYILTSARGILLFANRTEETVPLKFQGNSGAVEEDITGVLALRESVTPGCIVVLTEVHICDQSSSVDAMIMAINEGAVGILVVGGNYGCFPYTLCQHDTTKVTVPVVEIDKSVVSFEDFKSFISRGSINITMIQDTSNNPCRAYYQSALFGIIQGVLMIANTLNICLCLLRLFQFMILYNYDGVYLTIANVCIAIELVASLVRAVLIVDLYGGRNILPYNIYVALTIGVVPLNTITNVLIVMYWHEALINKRVTVSRFITVLRLPFFFLSGLLFLMCIFGVIVYLTPLNNDIANVLTGGFIIIVNVGLLIYQFIVLYRIYHRLYDAESTGKAFDEDKRASKSIARIKLRMIVNTTLLIVIILLTLTQIPDRQNPNIGVWLLAAYLVGYILLSTFQVYSFDPASAKERKKRSGTAKPSRPTSVTQANRSSSFIQTTEMKSVKSAVVI